jgi:hypothetical protein
MSRDGGTCRIDSRQPARKVCSSASSTWSCSSDTTATAPRDAYVSGGYYLDAAQLAPALGRPGGGAGGKALRDELWERSAAAVADAAVGRVRVAMAAGVV